MPKYGTNALIEFESIVDLDLGILRYAQLNFNKTKFIVDSILDYDDNAIKQLLLNRKDKNPLTVILKKEYWDNADKILADILDNHRENVLKISPPTSVFGLMQMYNKTEGVIHSTVLCKNKQDEQYIKKIDASINTIVADKADMVITNYDVMIIKNYEEILDYKKVEGKNIFLLKYNYNLEEGKEDIPLLKVSAFITDINKLYLVDVYVDLPTQNNNEGE